jgi:hypothetical protein
MQRPVTVNDLLDGRVGLDIECLDRIYLNGYVANLQVSGQVVSFLTRHLGYPIASPALFEKIGTRFRDDVRRDAAARGVPVARFKKGDRKIDVMRPLLAKAAATGRSQVVAVGVAQEFQRVFTGVRRPDDSRAASTPARVGSATSSRQSSSCHSGVCPLCAARRLRRGVRARLDARHLVPVTHGIRRNVRARW